MSLMKMVVDRKGRNRQHNCDICSHTHTYTHRLTDKWTMASKNIPEGIFSIYIKQQQEQQQQQTNRIIDIQGHSGSFAC